MKIKVRMGDEERALELPEGSTGQGLSAHLASAPGRQETLEFFDDKGRLYPDCQVIVNGLVKTAELQAKLKDGDRVESERIVIAGG